MEWLLYNWFWLLLAAALVTFSVVATRQPETQRYRVRLIISLLILEFWACRVTRTTDLSGLVGLAIIGFVLLRLCMPSLSHIVAQKMADKTTDAMFGEREPPPPSLERAKVLVMRKQRRYEEAVQHLQVVLEGSPDDFESRMLLAAIYAEDMFDLPKAEEEIGKLLDRQTVSPSVRAMAKQRLNLWQSLYRGESEPAEAPKLPPVMEDYDSAKTPNPIVSAVQAVNAKATPPPVDTAILNYQTVEDLCVAGNYGSAIAMIDKIIESERNDFRGLAIKARIYVQFLKQPAMADKCVRLLTAANDFDNAQAEAVNQLAEAFAKTKDDWIKAGRLWRKLLEVPSLSVEQKIVVQARLKEWQQATTG